jgi:hypothetical protein
MPARALEGWRELGVHAVEAGRDHYLHVGRNRGTRDQQGGRPCQPG